MSRLVLNSEPFWWYGHRGFGLPTALAPLSTLYGAIARKRMARAPAYVSRLPVICVGNFVAGGSGKSPVVRTLVGMLRDLGHTPAILTRGHGGRLLGPVWVDASRHSHEDVGDEPLMLATDAPVMVARRRDAGARAIEVEPDIDVIVMDDGLQNPDLAKSLSIAVVNGARGFGNGQPIPSGPLRAPLAAQLPYVDAVMVSDGSRTATVSQALEGTTVTIISTAVVPRPLVGVPQGGRVFVFAGIANPDRAFATARSLGLDVVGVRGFPDHHRFSEADIRALNNQADTLKAELVTTEKDIARLRTGSTSAITLAQRTHVLQIGIELSVTDEARLEQLLNRGVAQPGKA